MNLAEIGTDVFNRNVLLVSRLEKIIIFSSACKETSFNSEFCFSHVCSSLSVFVPGRWRCWERSKDMAGRMAKHLELIGGDYTRTN